MARTSFAHQLDLFEADALQFDAPTAPELVALIRAGAAFADGVLAENPTINQEAAA